MAQNHPTTETLSPCQLFASLSYLSVFWSSLLPNHTFFNPGLATPGTSVSFYNMIVNHQLTLFLISNTFYPKLTNDENQLSCLLKAWILAPHPIPSESDSPETEPTNL